MPRWRRRSWAATPAVLPSTVLGSLPSSPVMLVMRRPGLSEWRAITSSPGESIAKPSTSYPHATLATVAGANTLTSFKIGAGDMRACYRELWIFQADRARCVGNFHSCISCRLITDCG